MLKMSEGMNPVLLELSSLFHLNNLWLPKFYENVFNYWQSCETDVLLDS